MSKTLPPMSTFYLIRHALTDLVDKALAARAPGVSLNATGRRQAERLAERLAREPIGRIYTGPLERARETAAPLALRLGLEPIVSDALDEVAFGDWTGMTLEQLAPLPLWRRYNAYRGGVRAPGGELLLETQVRVIAFMARLRDEFPGQSLALFSHGDVVKVAVAFHLGVPLDLCHRIEILPASVSKVSIGDHGPVVHALNWTEP